MKTISRRQFVQAGALGAAGLSLAPTTDPQLPPEAQAHKRVAFNTANLVTRFTHYRFELAHWAEQHRKTVAMTDEAAWVAICREIAAAGFANVEIWEAHAAPESLSRNQAALWKRILDDQGLGCPGWYSWEDEPEDRNPFDGARRNREWLEERLRGAPA